MIGPYLCIGYILELSDVCICVIEVTYKGSSPRTDCEIGRGHAKKILILVRVCEPQMADTQEQSQKDFFSHGVIRAVLRSDVS